MLQDAYRQRATPLHAADARVKLIAVTACAVVVAVLQTTTAALPALGLGLAAAALARLSAQELWRRLAPANAFFIFLWISLGLTYPGDPLGDAAPASWLRVDGLALALLITMKGEAILLMMAALSASTATPALARALQDLGAPQKLTLLLAFTYRQVFIVDEEMRRLRTAARARCFRPRMNRHTYKTYAYLIAQTLARSHRRAARIQDAMRMRGFDGRFHTLATPRLRRQDLCWGAVFVAFALALLMLDLALAANPIHPPTV